MSRVGVASGRYAISDGRGGEVEAVEREGEGEVCVGHGGRGAVEGAGAGDGTDGDSEIAESAASDCGIEIHAWGAKGRRGTERPGAMQGGWRMVTKRCVER